MQAACSSGGDGNPPNGLPLPILSTFPVTEEIQDGIILSKIGYVALGDNGLLIVDLSNDSKIIELNRVAITGFAKVIGVARRYVFIGSRCDGITAVNIVNPVYNPKIESEYRQSLTCNPESTDLGITDMVALDTRLLLTFQSSAPEFEGFVIINTATIGAPYKEGALTDLYDPRALCVVGNRAYVLDKQMGLVIIDIENTFTPKIVNYEDSIFATSTPRDIFVLNGRAIVADDKGIRTFSVKDDTITAQGELTLAGLEHITMNGGHLFASAGDNGLQFIALDNLAAPQLFGQMTFDDFIVNIAIEKDLGLILSRHGLILAEGITQIQ
jgi:hypothetical protein